MPTYVYRCEQCQETFEQVETMSEHGASKPQCPKCGEAAVIYQEGCARCLACDYSKCG